MTLVRGNIVMEWSKDAPRAKVTDASPGRYLREAEDSEYTKVAVSLCRIESLQKDFTNHGPHCRSTPTDSDANRNIQKECSSIRN